MNNINVYSSDVMEVKEMKKQAKRGLSLLLALVMMLSAIPAFMINASAATNSEATITVNSVWGTPGSTVTVDVVISENPGILAGMITASWDERLTLTDDESGEAFSYMTYTPPSRYKPKGTNFAWYANEVGKIVDGTILTLTFKISDEVEPDEILPVTITYNEGDVFDGNSNEVVLNIISGNICVVVYKPGDVTNDGNINMLDVVRLSQYVSDGCATDPDGYNAVIDENASDVTGDGRINLLDVVRLSQYISDGCKTVPNSYNAVLLPAGSAIEPEIPETEPVETEAPETDPELEASEGLEYTLNSDGKSYSVTGIGTCKDTHVVISATYNNLPVTSIGDRAFYYCRSLTSVTIGNGVTSIGTWAFVYCDSLTSVTIPDSVTSIGSDAFYGCDKLVEVINKSSLSIIAGSSSYGFIGYYAKGVHGGPSKIVNKDGYLFYTYDGVNYLLGYVGNDTDLILPESYNGQNYEIYKNAFYKCSSLTSITIPDSVTSIGSYAFYDCYSLTSITIPDSVTSIGSYAFERCDSLTSITIPDSVTSIGTWAFAYCDSLTNIEVDDDNKHYKSIDGNLYSKDGKILINYAFGKTATSFIIPDSVTSIGNHAFSWCSNLTSITIPDSVTSIGNDAFANCYSLTSVEFGENSQLTSIGKYAFADCYSLTSITIPDSVTSIGNDAFSWCSNLTSITIPDGVTSIGNGAFYSCDSLTSIIIPDSVISIGDSAFAGCYSLTSITIPDSATSIGGSAFFCCDSLTSITYKGTVSKWNKISKKSSWDSSTGNYTIYCTDGEIAKDGTVTYY